MEHPCDTCPRYTTKHEEVADFARRVTIADARSDELLADSSIIGDIMDSSVARLGESDLALSDGLSPDEELYAMIASDDEVPNLEAHATQLATDLYASIPVLRAKRHADLDARIEALSTTRRFCEALGSCAEELFALTENA